ncbi:hypothetical protein D3C72_2158160 [compost metagenome]
MVMADMPRFSIGPCLRVTLPAFASIFLISAATVWGACFDSADGFMSIPFMSMPSIDPAANAAGAAVRATMIARVLTCFIVIPLEVRGGWKVRWA